MNATTQIKRYGGTNLLIFNWRSTVSVADLGDGFWDSGSPSSTSGKIAIYEMVYIKRQCSGFMNIL